MGLMINKINVWIGGRTRTFFGWTHANMMGLDFLLLAMDIMCLRKECKNGMTASFMQVLSSFWI